jgi:uncharacterized protein involved in outer membrane biogenesis
MRPWKKTLTMSAAGALALPVAAVLLLSVINWNFAKPWLEERVSQATDRSFAINGDLELSWRRPAEVQSGWRRLVPWPHLRAHDLELGNPQWATTGPLMLGVPQVDFSLNPLALLGRTLRVPTLVLTEPALTLEIGPDGQNNWTFRQQQSASTWTLDLRGLDFNNGTVRLVDPAREADVTTRIDTLADGSVRWKISGVVGDDKVSGDGKAGSLLALRDRAAAYPVEARLVVGESRVTANGTLTNPRQLAALDLELKISGASMGQLFPFSGIVLPATPKFSTEGRLVGTLRGENLHLRYEKFTGQVGSSDLAGTLEYLRKDRRAQLRGEVVSNTLNLDDLGALFATGDEQGRGEDEDQKKQPPGKVLPVGSFRTERWDKIDAHVTFTGKKIVRRENLPLEDLFARIEMERGVLTFAPLNFGVAGGKFSTELRIEGNSEPAQARMKVTARGLKLNRLFPEVEPMQASLGEMHVNAALSGTGNSIAALAASADGEARAFVSDGTISKFILEAMGLNIGSVIVTQLFGDHQVRLNCLASDFEVKDGVMQARTFVVDTDDAIIGVQGKVDLGEEKLGLSIHPKSKGVRVFSLRAPLYVQGTFKNPDVGVDKETVGAKAAAATALGVVASPLAALLALVNPGPDEESPCPGLLAQAKEKPAAPVPGKKSSDTVR